MKHDSQSMDRMYRISFPMIRLMHDNVMIRLLIDPARLLRDLGLQRGRSVLEVGCGPGFYTLGAAEAVGPDGKVFAYEVNPYACGYVEEKLARCSIKNVQVENKNAAESELSDASIDFAFVTGVPHIAGGTQNLLEEIQRVLKPGGILAYKPSRGDSKALIEATRQLKLEHVKTQKRFLIFVSQRC